MRQRHFSGSALCSIPVSFMVFSFPGKLPMGSKVSHRREAGTVVESDHVHEVGAGVGEGEWGMEVEVQEAKGFGAESHTTIATYAGLKI